MSKSKNNNEETEKDTNTILIAKMYTGSYVNRRFNNIGHEIINFIKPDNKKEIYGYIINDGKIGREIKTILFISNAKNGKAKIIAKVNNPTIIDDDNYENEQNNIKNGGKSLIEIMKQGADLYGRYITYSCNKNDIQFAKEGQYIYIENTKEKDSKKENSKKLIIPYLRTKTYISKADKDVYNLISKLIDSKNKEIWEDNDNNKIKRITEKEKEKYENLGDNNLSFMDLIQAEYNEEIISNMLKYYFEKENVLQRFMNELVKNKKINISKINIEKNIKIYREKHLEISEDDSKNKKRGRIDLFIDDETNKNVIVIENKIESGIHGKAYEDGKTKTSQLEVYYEWINNFKEDENKEKKYEKYNKIFLIFVPNYRKNEIKFELNQYSKEQKDNIQKEYKIITYSEIYDFFKDSSNFKFEENSREYYYFQDFLNVLSIHKMESNYEMIRRKFINAINMTKDNQKENYNGTV